MSLKHKLNKQGCAKEATLFYITTTLCENQKKACFNTGERTLSKESVFY